MYFLVPFYLLIYLKCIGTYETRRQEKCMFLANPGPCNGHFRMFAYDFTNNGCVMFIYGGCGGNPNRFQTKEECRIACNAPADPEDDVITSTEKYEFTLEQKELHNNPTEPSVTPPPISEEVTTKKEEQLVTLKESMEAFTLFNFELFG
ncbi:kappaPI-stichotoxin-Shd2a [Drosophila ficusphila]|uniref:kappaPI-stichotoxin-Shd2a n=1 Tax=Drosophila ficusphila TaxID=30025 RepID=UPI0007E75FB8|nr:kappaPI-stichotoxin-Shd2a [Drosophila ficusphila]